MSLRKYSAGLLLALAGIVQPRTSFAGKDREWNTDRMDKQLVVGADAVVRLSEEEVEVLSPEKVMIRKHRVVTILNKEGAEYAQFMVSQSKLHPIRSLSGTLYDASGKEIRHVKAGDFLKLPISMISDMYSDEEAKMHQFAYSAYPYTVEYEVENEQVHSFILPDWDPQPGSECAVEHASLRVTVPEGFGLRYRLLNTDAKPAIAKGPATTYTWQLNGLHAFKPEPLASTSNGGAPEVLLAPNSFSMGSLTGNMDSWQGLGDFVYRLNKGRNGLPADVKSAVHQLTDREPDRVKKIRLLYQYLQQHTRYVSMQYGIGGWQTIEAAQTAKNQFGDCKGLSNYMQSLLEEAGIKSYTVLINAGTEQFYDPEADFPAAVFNHVIVCVPNGKDSLWLECTSNSLPAGYLGEFTQNRNALLVTATGGVLVHTPAYDTTVNVSYRTMHGSIGEDNRCNMSLTAAVYGWQAQRLEGQVRNKAEQEISNYLEQKFGLASYTFSNYHFSEIPDAPVKACRESLDLSITGNASVTGSRMFVNMDFAPPSLPSMSPAEVRKQPFALMHAIKFVDTFRLAIPAGMEVESIPAPVVEKQPFGAYSCTIAKIGNELVLVRRVSMMYGRYPAEQYNQLVAWVDKISDERHKKVVLKRG